MVNVLIVDDSRFIRSALERVIESFPNYSAVSSVESAAGIDVFCSNGRIDLILMDICMADDESGIAAATRIKDAYPRIKIILMTSTPEHSFIQKAKTSGADSFWYKDYGNVRLIDVCERTMNGEHVWPKSSPVVIIGQARSDEFTERELSVIRGLVHGARYEDLAEQMHLSINTVKYHVKNILQKTGFRTTNQLVAAVVEKRFVLPKY